MDKDSKGGLEKILYDEAGIFQRARRAIADMVIGGGTVEGENRYRIEAPAVDVPEDSRLSCIFYMGDELHFSYVSGIEYHHGNVYVISHNGEYQLVHSMESALAAIEFLLWMEREGRL